MLLTAEAILNRAKVVRRECPELGGEIDVRRITAAELMSFKDGVGIDQQCQLIALAVVDESGKPLFTEAQVKLLDAAAYLAISRAVIDVNGLSEKSLEKKASSSTSA